MQLKLEHSHFEIYQKRLPGFDSDKCDCNNQSSQSPAHLLLSCNLHKEARKKMKEKLKIFNLSLKFLLNSKKGIQKTFEFLKETKIARRKAINQVV